MVMLIYATNLLKMVLVYLLKENDIKTNGPDR
jgi:hypothetical protein